MLYTPLTKKALKICFKAHEGQVDKSGMPYVLHPLIVADHVEGEYETCIALLHDVVEDTSLTLEDLSREGMPEQVVNTLSLLTHKKRVPYLDYIVLLKNNSMARKVKLADLEHNMDLGRLDTVTQKDLDRVEKYKKAQAILLETEASHQSL